MRARRGPVRLLSREDAMQLFLCRRTVVSAWLVALALMLAAPAAGATALPERPIKKSGFRLLARASGSLKVNQVQCGLISNGQICVDSTGSSTIPRLGLAQGHQQPVHVQLGHLARRYRRRRRCRVGGRHHRRLLLRRQRLPAQRRAGGADLQRERRRPTWPMARVRQGAGRGRLGVEHLRPAAAEPDQRVAGRRLLPDLGRQPGP